MSEPLQITIDMGKKCAECGKGGATGSGICLGCASKAISKKPMRSVQGRAYQARILASLAAIKPRKP